MATSNVFDSDLTIGVGLALEGSWYLFVMFGRFLSASDDIVDGTERPFALHFKTYRWASSCLIL